MTVDRLSREERRARRMAGVRRCCDTGNHQPAKALRGSDKNCRPAGDIDNSFPCDRVEVAGIGFHVAAMNR